MILWCLTVFTMVTQPIGSLVVSLPITPLRVATTGHRLPGTQRS